MSTKMERVQQFKTLVKKIKRSNKVFNKATTDKRILMVAKDVIQLLNLDRIKATSNEYVVLKSKLLNKYRQVSDLLKMPEFPACKVCAIGGAMVASTMRLNDVNTIAGTIIGRDKIRFGFNTFDSNGMQLNAMSIFPEHLLLSMEKAFENGDYGYLHKSKKARLRAIYQNLIDNKGKFFSNHNDGNVVWRP